MLLFHHILFKMTVHQMFFFSLFFFNRDTSIYCKLHSKAVIIKPWKQDISPQDIVQSQPRSGLCLAKTHLGTILVQHGEAQIILIFAANLRLGA